MPLYCLSAPLTCKRVLTTSAGVTAAADTTPAVSYTTTYLPAPTPQVNNFQTPKVSEGSLRIITLRLA